MLCEKTFGRELCFYKFSLKNTAICKWHCQLLRCNTMFFWSPKFLEAKKLGEVLTWHLNERKHISSTLFLLFQVFHCRISLSLMDFLMDFLPLNNMEKISLKKWPSTWVPQYHGDQGIDYWAAPCSGSQWR